MKVPLLSALVLLNAVLGSLFTLMPAVPEPEVISSVMISVPVSAPRGSLAQRPPVDQQDASETTMFGLGEPAAKKPVGATAGSPTIQNGDQMSLLGVLIAREGGDRETIVALMRHGRPPIVSRLALGGTLDGWKLVSATRTTVTLTWQDGPTRVLQISSSAKGKGSP